MNYVACDPGSVTRLKLRDLFWLTDEQMEHLRPFFPKGHGKLRIDDYDVLNGMEIFVRMKGGMNTKVMRSPIRMNKRSDSSRILMDTVRAAQ